MATFKQTELMLDHKFDNNKKRHFINGNCVVLHCHHFTTLYTQLADDAKDFGGERLLRETSEEVFNNVLVSYYNDNNIKSVEDKVSIAEQYYAAVGLGKLIIEGFGDFAGNAKLLNSHIDEGWLKKWGKNNKPINFITQGYLAGVFSAVNNKPIRFYKVQECDSIVCGAKESTFKIVS